MDKVRLVIGYGNPGVRHAKTKGNVGFIFLDFVIFRAINTFPTTVARGWFTKGKYQFTVSNQEPLTLVVKPRTYVKDFDNVSKSLFNFYKPEIDDFYIIYPDLGISFGDYEVGKDFGKTAPENVIKLQNSIDTGSFWKVRIGVGDKTDNIQSQEEIFTQELSNLEYGTIRSIAERLAPELKIVSGVVS